MQPCKVRVRRKAAEAGLPAGRRQCWALPRLPSHMWAGHKRHCQQAVGVPRRANNLSQRNFRTLQRALSRFIITRRVFHRPSRVLLMLPAQGALNSSAYSLEPATVKARNGVELLSPGRRGAPRWYSVFFDQNVVCCVFCQFISNHSVSRRQLCRSAIRTNTPCGVRYVACHVQVA